MAICSSVPTAYSMLRLPRVHPLPAAAPFAGTAAGRRLCAAPRAPLLRPCQASAAPDGEPGWYQGSDATADDFLEMLRQRRPGAPSAPGVVHLVGTGPGDPGLLTMRAVALMQAADVVLYDRLVSEEILGLVHGGALCVYVGKQRGLHTRSQEEIHELLGVFAGAGGAAVVRLKGGDPYVFGRGGEEEQYLRARGVPVHVVPGVTAASGISAELGIPLTHRGVATSVRFLTGHSRAGGEEALEESIAAACDPHTTLVVYMGLGTLPSLAAQLVAGGLPAGTPAVAVERGTTPEQRAVYAPLEGLPAAVAAAGLQSPTLIMVGQVVALSPGWERCQAAGVTLDPGAGAGAWSGGSATAADILPLSRLSPGGGARAPVK